MTKSEMKCNPMLTQEQDILSKLHNININGLFNKEIMSVFNPNREEQLMMNILSYGQRMRQLDGKEVEECAFADYNKVAKITDFVVFNEGCETYVEGHPYPVRGCFNDKGIIVHQFKRLIPTLLDSLDGNIFRKIIGLIYLALNWRRYLNFVHWGMRDVFYDRKFYQQPVREVYDLIDDEKIRDIVCAVLEHDDAYRYRFQDVLSELDKDAFEDHPIKELRRLNELYWERENEKRLKIKMAINLATVYLLFNRKLLKYVKEKVQELDLDEIKLSVEDIYWTTTKGGYKYMGLTNEERQ